MNFVVTPFKGAIILLVVTVFVLTGVFVWIRVQQSGEPESAFQIQPSSSTLPPQDETANWKVYRNTELGIEFRYPLAWGDLKTFDTGLCWGVTESQSRERDGEPCVDIDITASVDGGIWLFGAQSRIFLKYAPGRGAAVGDLFSLAAQGGISANDFVKDYCTKYSFFIIDERMPTERESCSVQTNTNGVLYAKTKAQDPDDPEVNKLFTYYFIAHPNHLFPGLILTTIGVDEIFQQRYEKIFDQILSTFRFIE